MTDRLAKERECVAARAGLQPGEVRADGQVLGSPLRHEVGLGRCATWGQGPPPTGRTSMTGAFWTAGETEC